MPLEPASLVLGVILGLLLAVLAAELAPEPKESTRRGKR